MLTTLPRGVAPPFLVAPPSRCPRGIAPRAHATAPVPFAASPSQRNHQQRPSNLRHLRRRPATPTSTSSAAAAVSSSSSSSSEPQRAAASTPVEGAVALVLDCISLARKADVEGLSARCRYPPPPGSSSHRVYFGKKKRLEGLGGAPGGTARKGGSGGGAADETPPSFVEETGPLAPFAASGFDGGARRVLPGNLLRRAAVLSALELAPGRGGKSGEEEEKKEEGEGGDKPRRGSARRRSSRNRLRRVLVRTRVVAHSGEEATLLWRAEREEVAEEAEEKSHGCWLVASVDRDPCDDDDDGGDFASTSESSASAANLSPHPRLGPEQVVCAAALDLARDSSGGLAAAERWWVAARRGSSPQTALELARSVLFPEPSASRRSRGSRSVTVLSSASPEPGVAVVETATTTGAGSRPAARLLWTLVLQDDGGCWGISEVARLH